MHKAGMTAPNDGSLGEGMIAHRYGAYLILHGGPAPFSTLAKIREAQGYDALVLVRFDHRISDPDEDILNDFRSYLPFYRGANGASLRSLVFMWENEPDGQEGEHEPDYIALRLRTVNAALRREFPGIALAGPNFAHDTTYQHLDRWIPQGGGGYAPDLTSLRHAVAGFDLLMGHWYTNAAGVDLLGDVFENRWYADPSGTLWANPLYGKPWGLSEYSSVGFRTNPAPDVEADAYDAIRRAYTRPYCVCVLFFMWFWAGAQDGWTGENIRDDPATLRGLDRALRDFPQVLTPILPAPAPADPPSPPPAPDEPPPPPVDPTAEIVEDMAARTALYFWQHNADYREKTYREFAETARDYNIQQVWMKAFEGGVWSASWDGWYQQDASGNSVYVPAPLAFDGVGKCQQAYEAFREVGVDLWFWGVPQGDTWRQDAAIAIEIGRACGGRIHSDIEGFAEFWNTPRWGARDMPNYCRLIRDAGLRHECSAVMRFGEPESFPWAEMHPLLDRVYSQSYWWPDFKRHDGYNVVEEDIWVMQQLGIPREKMGVCFPRFGSPRELEEAWQMCQEYGIDHIAGYVWQGAPLEFFEFFRALPRPPVVVEEDELTEEQKAAVRGALDEMYRINHQVIPPLVTNQRFKPNLNAAQTTWDQQLNIILDQLGLR